MTTTRRLGLLAALYVAQGLPYGFFTQALPVVLRENGVSLEAIGASSLLALPWALKALWAPLLDRVGTPRAWLLGLQATGALLMCGLAGLDPGASVGVLVGAVLLTNLVAATQDIATDGLAVRLLPAEERGLGNAAQVAGYRAGMIVGGGLLLIVWERAGWPVTALVMATLLAACALPLLAERSVGAERGPPSDAVAFGFDWVTLPGAVAWFFVLVAFKFGDYVGQGMLRPWLVDGGYDKAEIGALLGIGGFGAGLVGALLGGWSTPRLGIGRALVGFGLLQATGVGAWAVAATWAPQLAPAAVLWEHFVGGMATTALFTAMMAACRPSDASTDYTLQACLVVLASGVGSAVGGLIAADQGYAVTFAAAAALSLLGPLSAALPATARLRTSLAHRAGAAGAR